MRKSRWEKNNNNKEKTKSAIKNVQMDDGTANDAECTQVHYMIVLIKKKNYDNMLNMRNKIKTKNKKKCQLNNYFLFSKSFLMEIIKLSQHSY